PHAGRRKEPSMWANSKDAETQKKHLTQQPHVKNQVSESLTPEADSRIGIYLIHHGKQLLGEFAMSTPVPLRSYFGAALYFVTRYPKASDISSPPFLLRLLPAGAVAGWDLHPLESATFSRRTPKAVVR
ncbi:MAG: hypothetical protein WA231_01190, partial [Methylocella sp.]